VFQAVFIGAWSSSNDIRFRIHGLQITSLDGTRDGTIIYNDPVYCQRENVLFEILKINPVIPG
jgi:hypothetical protein